MSLMTWKKEFYSKKPDKKMSWIKAFEHSIKKWEGASKKNTKKHNVEYYNSKILYTQNTKVKIFGFDSDTCALCVKTKDDYSGIVDCRICPLCIHNSHESCMADDSAYSLSYLNPRPMIKELKRVLKILVMEEKKK